MSRRKEVPLQGGKPFAEGEAKDYLCLVEARLFLGIFLGDKPVTLFFKLPWALCRLMKVQEHDCALQLYVSAFPKVLSI